MTDAMLDDTNDLEAITIMLPKQALTLLRNKAHHFGRPVPFEVGITCLGGIHWQCVFLNLCALQVETLVWTQKYCRTHGYPDAIELETAF